jgi:hypothetical protein
VLAREQPEPVSNPSSLENSFPIFVSQKKTVEKSKTSATFPGIQRKGPIAQRLEQGTHNPLVVGSNPTGPRPRSPNAASRTLKVLRVLRAMSPLFGRRPELYGSG